MNRNRIVVIGNTNIDLMVKTSHIPVSGGTLLGGSFLMNPEGKGANQAVSIASIGGEVTFLSKIGNVVQ